MNATGTKPIGDTIVIATPEKTKHFYYLDVLRAVACLAVILVHASMTYAEREVGSVNFWIGNLCDSLVRFGVPIFVMISGALMLDDAYVSTREKTWRHIKKMLLFFLFWSTAYCLVFEIGEPLLSGETLNPYNIMLVLIGGYNN